MMMKKLIGGGLAALAVAVAVSVAPPVQAQYGAHITSIVYWTGPNCIPVRYSEGFYTNTSMICGRYSERHYYAVPGQYVGADPMPFDTTTTLGCSLLVNGTPDNTDYAPSGDRHNVDCLRVLSVISESPSYPSYQPPPPVYQPPPLLRAS
jgi:hypothetical protein